MPYTLIWIKGSACYCFGSRRDPGVRDRVIPLSGTQLIHLHNNETSSPVCVNDGLVSAMAPSFGRAFLPVVNFTVFGPSRFVILRLMIDYTLDPLWGYSSALRRLRRFSCDWLNWMASVNRQELHEIASLSFSEYVLPAGHRCARDAIANDCT